MASTREIRRRIRSIKNTAQIRALVSRLANAAGEDIGEGVELLKQRPVHNIGIVMITPDRGLSGALPSNINRKAAATALELQQKMVEQGKRPGIDYIAVGR